MSARRTRTAVIATVLSSLAVALPLVAHADAKKDVPAASKADEASQRFKSGVNFYKDKDFAAAMIDFKRAYELLPNWIVLYNLGQTARELKDYAAALNAYERYLQDGGAKVTAARRKEVTTAIEELRHKVGKIKITAVDGAEIGVDDVVIGTAPLPDSVVVNVGRRKVSATATGYTPAQRMIDVASMEEATVALELPKIEAVVKVVEVPAPPPPKPGPPVAGWVALSVTGAFGIATAVTGGLALSAHSSLKTALNTFPGVPTTISSDQSKTKTFAVATDVLGTITLVGAAATVVVFVVLPRTAKDPKDQAPAATVGLTPGGVAFSGRF